MIFTVVKHPIPFLIIDNTFTKDEQVKIYRELDFISGKLITPDKTGSAVKDGELKKNTGLFLENVYAKHDISDILTTSQKIFSPLVASELSKCHYAYNMFSKLNTYSTLVSYYDDNGSYFSHTDQSPITVVTWFFKSPRNFTGGEFIFTDYNTQVELKNNRTVIFFGCYSHQVTNVNIINKDVPFSGRYTITQFVTST